VYQDRLRQQTADGGGLCVFGDGAISNARKWLVLVNQRYVKGKKMNLRQLVAELNSPASRNETLNLIGQILDGDHHLVETLTTLIEKPEEIKDTHIFASILADLPQAEFIPPLIHTISQSEPGKTPWLSDYMYALGSILQDEDDCWQPEESFVHLLGNWLHSTGGGEIAWKSAVILSQLDHPATRSYFISGAADQDIFHQARTACINGIVNHYREEATTLLQTLINDPEPVVREKVAHALNWLESET